MLKWLKAKFDIDNETYLTIKQHIACAKPNSNGYDIRIDDYKILSEVKCNIPINDGVREAVTSLLKKFSFDKQLNGRVKIFTDINLLDKNYVYVVSVK